MKRSRPLLALTLSFGVLALVEIGLRIGGFQHRPARLPVIMWDVPRDLEMMKGESLHRRDAHTLWAPRAGAPMAWSPDERVSEDGFRARGPGPAVLRVLALGDSSTFGMGVADAETYSAYLEDALRSDPLIERRLAGGTLQVLNGGTIGFTVRQGLERYRVVRESWVPHVVVAAFGAVNEHFPMIVEPDIVKIANERAYWSPTRRALRWVGQSSRIAQLGLWWRDGGKAGRKERVIERATELDEGILPFSEYLDVPGYERRVSTADFRVAYEELLAEVRADGATLIVVQMPRRPDQEKQRWPILEYDPVLRAFAEENDVVHVDARALFWQRLEDGATAAELFVDGYHPTPQGQRILADALLAPVRAALLDARGSD